MIEPEQARRDAKFVMRLVLVAFVGTILLFVVAGKLPAEIKDLPTKLLFLSLGWIGWRRFRPPATGTALAGARRTAIPIALLAVGNIAASQACALLLVVPLVMLGGRVTPPTAGVLSLAAVTLSWLINVAVTVPGEELLFRGAVLPALRPWGDRTAFVVSAVLFAMAHVSFTGAFLWALLLGLLTGLARLRTGSLVSGMLLHGLGNTLGVAMSFSVPLNELMGSLLAPGLGGLWVVGGILIVLLAWAGLVALTFRRLGWRFPERLSPPLPTRRMFTASTATLVVLYVLINVALTASMFKTAPAPKPVATSSQ